MGKLSRVGPVTRRWPALSISPPREGSVATGKGIGTGRIPSTSVAPIFLAFGTGGGDGKLEDLPRRGQLPRPFDSQKRTPMTTEQDLELIARLRTGGAPILAELLSEYRARLERMVHFRMDPRLSSRVDVGDVLQEAYLDAAKRVDHYLANPSAPFFVWLRGITLNTLMDVHRRHLGTALRDAGKEVSLYRGAADATSELLAAQLVGRLTSPSQAMMREELVAQVEQALRQMDEMDREVLALRHFEQLSNNEVAEVLGLTKTAASNRYVRALARLREILLAIPGLREQYGEESR